MRLYTKSPAETIRVGKQLALILDKGDIVGFVGELGSGKTTIIKGIVAAITGKIATSPTFVIVNEYQGTIPVFHFDLYRLKYHSELTTIGWDEYPGKGIILIEWADRVKKLLPKKTIFIKMSIVDGKRKICISGLGKRKSQLLTIKNRGKGSQKQ